MRIKYLFYAFLLAMLMGRVAIGEEKKGDFLPVKAGEIASFDGYLFTPEAIVKIYTKTEEEKKLLRLDCEHKIELGQIDIQKLIDIAEEERKIQAKLLQDTVSAKDEIIQNKINLIDKLNKKQTTNNFLIVGSFIAGSVITYTLVYYTIGLVK